MWPVVIALWLTTAVLLLRSVRIRHSAQQSGWINVLLAVHWIWSGLVYHAMLFARVNPAARLFAILFFTEGCFVPGVRIQQEPLTISNGSFGCMDHSGSVACLVCDGIPGSSPTWISQYPRVPVFAVPCPTTILKAGLLLMSVSRTPIFLIVIPIFWCVIGTSATVLLPIRADWALAVAGFALLGASMAPKKVGIVGP